MPARAHWPTVAPFQGVLVGCAAALFLGGLISDIAYARSYEVQWINMAAWLLVGGMVFAGLALAWSLLEVIRGPARRGRPLAGFLLLLVMFLVGLVDCFMHARDAWGTMPMGLVLSAVLTGLSVAALWCSVSVAASGGAE